MGRSYGTDRDGNTFGEDIIEAVWEKGVPDPNFTSFRRDKCNASMQRGRYGKTVQFGWEIDHIKPVSKGGTDDLSNLQPLQWENNRHKADDFPEWSCRMTT